MTSLFEGLPESGVQGARIVLPLEFHALDESGRTSEMETVDLADEGGAVDEIAVMEQRLAAQSAEIETRVEAARREALVEARETLQREYEERVALERTAVSRLGEQFGKERAKYFADVEAEVVGLALSIAARVLHREAELDPLLLRGAVKVALEKVQEGSAVTLRVPEEQVQDWQEIFAGRDHVGLIVLGDARLAGGDCVLETSVGRVELGIKTQLQEIERGFFDLLEQRPA
jgi:flagellar assembly protein FliH